MRRYLIISILSLLCLFCFGCFSGDSSKNAKELVLYSTLEPKLTEELLASYNDKIKKKKGFQPVKAIYELEANKEPDMVVASTFVLTSLKKEGKLQPLSCKSANLLAFDYKDVEGYWIGAFCDPVVFVINHAFARRVGQKNLQGWNDIEKLSEARFVMENLSNSPGTMNLLAAMAGHMGEKSAINYMWNANRQVTQYTKFPFSSIRMVAMDEADMTVTVQSMVSKYLENEFPAYVITPKEGAPANLYGIAVFKGSENTYGNQDFMDWLISNDDVKVIAQKQDAGFVFLLQEGKPNPLAEPRKIWLNRDYLTLEKLEALTNVWVEKVRFSSK